MRPFYRAQKHVSALNWQIVNICLNCSVHPQLCDYD